MSWNKGLNKYNSSSVLKISETFKKKKINNFRVWLDSRQNRGEIPVYDSEFKNSKELAELIGVVLGDGNISQFPRTERLIVVGNSNNLGFIKRYAFFIEELFGKKPLISKITNANAIRISLYQKYISKRLNIPTGNRCNIYYEIPLWIKENRRFLIYFLKGLFEAEASLSIHVQTCTYNFQFCNYNKSLLESVKTSLEILGYHPEVREIYIRLRKKQEVISFKNLIQFRSY